MGDFLMPSLGADMTEGTLVEWLVHPGETVHRGDIVAAVDTSKSLIEVETFEDGVIDQLLVTVGTTVPVGTPLARLAPLSPRSAGPVTATAEGLAAHVPSPPPGADAGSPVIRRLAHQLGVELHDIAGTGRGGKITRADVQAAADRLTQRMPVQEPAAASPARVASGTTPERMTVTPYARRRAADLGVDLSALQGSGSRGAITARDVEAAARPQGTPSWTPVAPSIARSTIEPDRASAMRQAIGALMARSKREIPHYYLQTTLDLSACLDWLHVRNDGRPVAERLLPVALLLKAAALAVHHVPEVNGFYVAGRFTASTSIHLGVAVSLRGGGLIAPALHDAQTLSVEEVMDSLKDLVSRARSGRLRASEMNDPTITVTNLGDQGVEAVHGVIYPPQVALVGLGRVVDRPWAVNGLLGIRPVLTATLAADHRVSDGHRGGLYLSALDELLQKPENL